MATQRPLAPSELAAVLAPVGTPVGSTPLSGGLFAAVDLVELADGRRVVVKTGVASGAGRVPLLTYEHDLLRAEVVLLRHAEATSVPTPGVVLADLSRRVVEVDVLVMEHLPGRSWEDVRGELTETARHRVEHEWGAVLAGFHGVRGDVFGYPSSPGLQGSSWPGVFTAMIEALLADATTWGVEVEADRVRAALLAVAPDLAQVAEPVLVHMDLWPGNVLLDPATGEITGIVDLERGLFGDPLMDLVGAEAMSVGVPSGRLLDGYRAAGGRLPLDPAAGTPSGLDRAADRRLAVYRLYLTLLMTIEVVPRAYSEVWVPGYVDQLVDNRRVLLEHLEAPRV